MKIILLKYCLTIALLVGGHDAFALVPLEGLLKGEVSQDIQFDPLSLVFQVQESSNDESNAVHKRYISHYQESLALKQSCDYLGPSSYASTEDENRAKRSVVATLQYIGLDATVKAIGSYARTIQMSDEDYKKLTDNLVISSCSPNISVYGIKLIKQNLERAFSQQMMNIPAFPGLPFVAKSLTDKTNSLATKEQELHNTTLLFRAFCSWGSETSNYRLLPPLLSSPLIMSNVVRHLENKGLSWDSKKNEVSSVEGKGAVQVSCQNLICRRVEYDQFKKVFPRAVGSTGISQDVKRLWCNHFRYQTFQNGEAQHPQVRSWLKKIDPEHENLMVGQMLSLLTGVPDIFQAAANFKELGVDLRSSVDERWDQWAKTALSGFSKDLLYEESLEIKVKPRRDRIVIRDKLFAIDFSVTMGELDRLLANSDKLRLDTSFKLSRNWLRWLRTEWTQVNQKADPEAREEFVDKVAEFLKPQVEAKKKFFPTPLFGEGLEQLLALELIEQVLLYQGSLFDTFEEKMINVPVRFHYGMFALSYMRYKAQIKAKHKTLDL
ncbi:MAG: hypothetical protein K2P81_01085 [Bacteriovoracaceae bacterium]|nr:hypothetical protein [Bacteriovoracaceae bacterium]